jgi:ABC-type multidrug transport system ATPase subunit
LLNLYFIKVSGIIYPGQCLAIMGASGSGKTTLLSSLTFRTPRHFRVNGNIKINGEKVSADELCAYVGFVPQDDLFIGTLTVFEHLKFMVKKIK